VRRLIAIDIPALRTAAGIGVAGNFAGHLEQAGEAADFVNVAAEIEAPKGIFPWYRPRGSGQLGAFPISSDRLIEPVGAGPVNLQIEPEVGVLFAVRYDADGRVAALQPRVAAAFNDCSIRRPNATRISDKKNWGPCSKGLAERGFEIVDLEPGGGLAGLRIASFLRRAGVVREYGIDSPAAGYSYSGARLVEWIVERLHNQAGAADTPLEPVGPYLNADGRPDLIVVGIGATRYTAFGEGNYLASGDESIVIVYDETRTAPGAVADAVAAGIEGDLDGASVLVQAVCAA
jgi:hypothetical protein